MSEIGDVVYLCLQHTILSRSIHAFPREISVTPASVLRNIELNPPHGVRQHAARQEKPRMSVANAFEYRLLEIQLH